MSQSGIIGRQFAFARKVRNFCFVGAIVAVAFCLLTNQGTLMTIAAPMLVFVFGMAIFIWRAVLTAVQCNVVVLTIATIGRSSRPFLYWMCIVVMTAMAAVLLILVGIYINEFGGQHRVV